MVRVGGVDLRRLRGDNNRGSGVWNSWERRDGASDHSGLCWGDLGQGLCGPGRGLNWWRIYGNVDDIWDRKALVIMNVGHPPLFHTHIFVFFLPTILAAR